MAEKDTSPDDPRGLISEAYRMEGLYPEEARSIYLDWAFGLPAEIDAVAATARLHARYAAASPAHPMTAVLAEGVERTARPPARRGRRREE